ncbi:hypothetical protein ACIPW5_39640 [Streptomyces sp. NPDC090077]|uniref:hypothetical protein n=1 Tax=Streptomyces sp. NPDC090077 TaxID=3365938 RepID=UPI003823DD5B
MAVENRIAAARELAERVGGEAGDVHLLSFGRVNVALHDLGAAITMRSYDQALAQARNLKMPPSALTSRRARYMVDRALVPAPGHLQAEKAPQPPAAEIREARSDLTRPCASALL